jgi:hypothetical protein
MARDRHRDEEYDREDYPPPRSSASQVLIVALVVGGLLVVEAVACQFVGLWAFRAEPQPMDGAVLAEDQGPPPIVCVYTRAEFKELVLGKTADEVLATVATPDHTEADEFGTYWHYRRRTMDPETGKTDPDTRLEFKDGRVSGVNF